MGTAPLALAAPASGQQLPPVTAPPTTAPLVTVPPVTLPDQPVVTVPGAGTSVVLPPVTAPALPALPSARRPASPTPAAPGAGGSTSAPAAPLPASASPAAGAGTSGAPGATARAGAGPDRARLVPPPATAAGGLPTRMQRTALATARQLSFPMGLAVALLMFLVVQHRMDARDPRLALPAGDDDLLGFS